MTYHNNVLKPTCEKHKSCKLNYCINQNKKKPLEKNKIILEQYHLAVVTMYTNSLM